MIRADGEAVVRGIAAGGAVWADEPDAEPVEALAERGRRAHTHRPLLDAGRTILGGWGDREDERRECRAREESWPRP